MGRRGEDLLHVLAHVALEHLVALVEDEVADVAGDQQLLVNEGEDAAGGSDHHVRVVLLQDLLVLLDGEASEEVCHLHALEVAAEALKLVADLQRKKRGGA